MKTTVGIALIMIGFGGFVAAGFGGEAFEIVKFFYSIVGVLGMFFTGIFMIIRD